MTVPSPIPRPLPDEHEAEVGNYIARVPGDDARPALARQRDEVARRFGTVTAEGALHRYAPGKWSVAEVLGHVVDCERIYGYRALRLARGDPTPLPGFDENRYVVAGRFDAQPLDALLEAWRLVRASSIALYDGLDAEALARRGVANERLVSVRALAWLTVGHAAHHLDVLRERYGLR